MKPFTNALLLTVAIVATAIVSDAGPSTGYYPKTASFPPSTCGVGQVIRWGGVTWACAPVSNIAPVQSVTGTSPISVASNDAGVYNVGLSTDGGINIATNDGGVPVGFDLDVLKIKGVTVMGPAILSPNLYTSDGTGSVSVIQTQNISSLSVNLSTEGTIDWYAPVVTWQNRKATAGSAVGGRLSPPVLAFGGCAAPSTNTISGGAGSTPYVIDWTPSDSTSPGPSLGNVVTANYAACGDNPGSGAVGLVFTVPAEPYTQVFRQYLQIGTAVISAFQCVGSMTDGSGTATTSTISTASNNYFKEEWTFHSSVIGASLVVFCRTTGTFAGTIAVVWYGQTLARS